MSDTGESNGLVDHLEENSDSVENQTDNTDQIPIEEESQPKTELENVKSSSPVVYIALILTSFFALGMYEVQFSLVINYSL